MEVSSQTSFIPKKPVVGLSKKSKKSGSGLPNLVFTISVIMFLSITVVAGGMYGYAYFLNQEIKSSSEQLTEVKDRLEIAALEELRLADIRLDTVDILLGHHRSGRALLEYLGANTLDEVTYLNLAFNYEQAGETRERRITQDTLAEDSLTNPVSITKKEFSFLPPLITITMNGEADSFEAIASQARILVGDTENIKNPLFSNFSLTEEELISFTLTAEIDSGLVRYSEKLERQANSEEALNIRSETTSESSLEELLQNSQGVDISEAFDDSFPEEVFEQELPLQEAEVETNQVTN